MILNGELIVPHDHALMRFKKIGKNVSIGNFVKIVNPEKIEIDDFSRIDDFSLIVGGQGVSIGKFVHIASFCSVIGGGKFIIKNFSTLAAGCRIITGSDDYSGKCLTNPCVPQKYRNHAIKGRILIKEHVILGTNTIVMPNVQIGDGCAIGAGTFINKNLKPWGTYIGAPARWIKKRPQHIIKRMEHELVKETYG